MKSKKLLLALAVAATAQIQAAEWEFTGGPLGGLGYDVRIDPRNKQVMYLTDNFAGVLKSTDGGATWVQKNEGISVTSGPTGDEYNIFSLTIDPNDNDIIWAGSNSTEGKFGVFKSSNAGETWTKMTFGISDEHPDYQNTSLVFRGFTIEPGNSQVVYAQAQLGTGEQGATFEKVLGRVFKTTDGGNNWTTVWEGNNLARYLIVDPENTSTLYLSTGIFDIEAIDSNCEAGVLGGEGLLKSTDGGASWQTINSGIEDSYLGTLRMHPENPQILYAGGVGSDACQGMAGTIGGLYRTVNGGENWQRLAPNLITGPVSAVNFSPSNSKVIYAGFENAIYHSSDGGQSWSEYTKNGSRGYGPLGINAGIPIDMIVDPDNSSVLFASNYGGGLFKSSDNGRSWIDSSKGYSGAVIYDLAVSGSHGEEVLVSAKSGVFKSSSFGADWTGLARGEAGSVFESASIAAHPENPDIILQANQFEGKLFRSSDGGLSFTEVYDHPGEEQQINRIVFAPSNPDIVYASVALSRGAGAAEGPLLLKSTNAGQSFSALTTGSLFDDSYIRDIAVDPENASLLYVALSDPQIGDDDHLGAVLLSSNGGASFGKVLGNGNFGALVAGPNGLVVAGALWGGQSAGVYVSNDSGASWSGPHTAGLGFEPYITDLVRHPDGRLFAAEQYSGVYVSSDNGRNWDQFPNGLGGLTNRAANALAVNDKALYAGTQGGGVFRYAFGELTVPEEPEVPEEPKAEVDPSVYAGGVLTIPVVQVGKTFYRAELKLIGNNPFEFQLSKATIVENPQLDGIPVFDKGLLSVPEVVVGNKNYLVNMSRIGSGQPIRLRLKKADPL